MNRLRAGVLIFVASCYTQPRSTLYTLSPPEQCAQSALVMDNAMSGENGGLYGASNTMAPGQNGGLYGASSTVAPPDNGGVYGATTNAAPGESGGLYGASQRANQDQGCRPPASPAEQCSIRAMQASAQLKHQSNTGEVAPATDDQIAYVRSSAYQQCMAGSVNTAPGNVPPSPAPPQ